MQFYDTPRNVREAIECPPPNPLGNYDYPTAGKDEHTLNTLFIICQYSTLDQLISTLQAHFLYSVSPVVVS